ncbi:MAG: hypothetical protein A2544_00715 [Candidatus Zambryskibacteria bacterium RIFOXYD2_FULL_43_10]|uniref:MaoC-like domain-containing protein n=1 Tax=Candidatus Zambryskibacteria bacterium RIFOXYD2_FULL_43_10 TaxID=1802782 RepID=A0A1G2V7F9_9BACT|nr:MAG: hypothetical protein A2544_00715 [Candidatus Zambryskibacteria bacterium RIFOXYD2_FULL_43_10]
MNTSWEWAKEFPPASEEAIRGFAASIGDNNPIHHDNIAAINGGLRKIVAPGLMVMGFLSAAIAEEIPGVMISEINRLQFKRPLYPGVSPTVLCAREHEHGRLVQLRFEIRDNGEGVIARGSCTLVLPPESS